MIKNKLTGAIVAAALALVVPATISPALAGAGHASGHGKPGKASAATRTIKVTMKDNFYEPNSISVKPGETVKFIVTNKGELVHEFNIGTPMMHTNHKKEMLMMMEHGVLGADKINRAAAKKMQAAMGHGMHNDPNSALLEPGKSATIIWTFPKEAKIEFACNVPGHYEAGMVGVFALGS